MRAALQSLKFWFGVLVFILATLPGGIIAWQAIVRDKEFMTAVTSSEAVAIIGVIWPNLVATPVGVLVLYSIYRSVRSPDAVLTVENCDWIGTIPKNDELQVNAVVVQVNISSKKELRAHTAALRIKGFNDLYPADVKHPDGGEHDSIIEPDGSFSRVPMLDWISFPRAAPFRGWVAFWCGSRPPTFGHVRRERTFVEVTLSDNTRLRRKLPTPERWARDPKYIPPNA